MNDWNVCHCAAAGSDYTSESCKCARSATIDMSEVNGGVCRTLAAKANRPYALDCAPLDYDGTLAVINAPEDIVIQWRYGRALYRGYREKYGRDKTKYYKFRGRKGAGHAVMMQYPKWVQSKIYTTLTSSD